MGLIGTVDYQMIKAKDAVFYQALNLGPAQGTLADGRQYFWCDLGNMSSSNRTCGSNPNLTTNSKMLGNTDKRLASSLTVGMRNPMSDHRTTESQVGKERGST